MRYDVGSFGIQAEGCRGDAACASLGDNEGGFVDTTDDATVPVT